MYGNLGEYVGDDGNGRQVDGTTATEAAFQELRHGEYIGTQIERHKNPTEHQQDEAGQPFKVSNRQPGRGARARQTDKVFGRDVGNEQGRADREPTHIATGQKVVGGSALFAGKVQSDRKDNDEIDANDNEINGRQCFVRDVRNRHDLSFRLRGFG